MQPPRKVSPTRKKQKQKQKQKQNKNKTKNKTKQNKNLVIFMLSGKSNTFHEYLFVFELLALPKEGKFWLSLDCFCIDYDALVACSRTKQVKGDGWIHAFYLQTNHSKISTTFKLMEISMNSYILGQKNNNKILEDLGFDIFQPVAHLIYIVLK